MIKEIVDLGRVSNYLASTFTMKVDYLDYIRVEIDEDFKVNIKIDSFEEKEEFLRAGVFRERSGNKIIFFPNSFVLEIDKKGVKTKLEFFENSFKYVDNEFVRKIYEVIKIHFEIIKEKSKEIVEVKNNEIKKLAVCIYYKDKPVYEYENLFEKFKDAKISLYFNEYKKGFCNILGIEDKLFYPKANFYYPFSVDKKIVKFNLKDDKNLFLISKKAIEYFFAGKEYLENFNRYKILGTLVYISASSFDLENIKIFERLVIKNEEKNLKSLVNLFQKSAAKLRENILMNFYFHTSPAQGSKEIISYIKDVMPTYLLKLDKSFEKLAKEFKDIFNKESKYYTSILFLLSEEKNKRELIEIFSKIVLNKQIDFNRLLYLINRKVEKQIIKYKFDLNFYLFLIWLKGGEVKEIKGNSYEERLEYVLSNFDLIKESDSAKIGVCVGAILKILSFSINDYDKKILAFVSKKLSRDKKSLLKFITPIFEKAKLHQKSMIIDINIKCASEYVANLKEFNKEEFIFGLFLGDELFNYLKGEKDE